MKKFLKFFWYLTFTIVFFSVGFNAPAEDTELSHSPGYFFNRHGDFLLANKLFFNEQIFSDHFIINNPLYTELISFRALDSHRLTLSFDNPGPNDTDLGPENNNLFYRSASYDLDYNESFKSKNYDFTYSYDFIRRNDIINAFSLKLVGQLKFLNDWDLLDTEKSDKLPARPRTFPMLGLDLNFGILTDSLMARILTSGMDYENGSVMNGRADLIYSPLPFIDIYGGFRFFYIDIEDESEVISGLDSGSFAGFEIKF